MARLGGGKPERAPCLGDRLGWVSSARVPAGWTVERSRLRLGQLLAEGGEGRVYELVDSPGGPGRGYVYKELREPRPLGQLQRLVAFPSRLAEHHPGLAARARSASAWPVSAVVGDQPEVAVGTVMPRAPERFWLRHRDGSQRLATLSYLTTAPDRLAVAYGVVLPEPGEASRVAVVYALARLLEAWQAGHVVAVHGDLSAKNVLWSLGPVPAVYVLDCDDASVLGCDDASVLGREASGVGGWEPGGAAHAPPGRPRATTPNWDDPAVQPGNRPGCGGDRYSLALVFLRVVGAAHFPLQGRQRAGERVKVALEVPRQWRRLPDMPRLWDLCERSLSVAGASERPVPAEWVVELEDLLGSLGRADLAHAVREGQGDPARSVPVPLPVPASGRVADVEVRPVLRRRLPSTWQLVGPSNRSPLQEGPGAVHHLPARQVARWALVAWARAHLWAAWLLLSPGRRAHGLRRLAGLVSMDLVVACVSLFIGAMVVSPWIGL